jgi:hypothetical protein
MGWLLKSSNGATQMKDRYSEGHAQRRVDQLKIGDRVDLQYDRYADPEGFRGVESNHPEFAFAGATLKASIGEATQPCCMTANASLTI